MILFVAAMWSLSLILASLKMATLISWSWWAVTSPLWLSTLVGLGIFAPVEAGDIAESLVDIFTGD